MTHADGQIGHRSLSYVRQSQAAYDRRSTQLTAARHAIIKSQAGRDQGGLAIPATCSRFDNLSDPATEPRAVIPG